MLQDTAILNGKSREDKAKRSKKTQEEEGRYDPAEIIKAFAKRFR